MRTRWRNLELQVRARGWKNQKMGPLLYLPVGYSADANVFQEPCEVYSGNYPWQTLFFYLLWPPAAGCFDTLCLRNVIKPLGSTTRWNHSTCVNMPYTLPSHCIYHQVEPQVVFQGNLEYYWEYHQAEIDWWTHSINMLFAKQLQSANGSAIRCILCTDTLTGIVVTRKTIRWSHKLLLITVSLHHSSFGCCLSVREN